MNEIASPGQLRMSFVRWALVTVPLIVILGSFMGYISNSGYDNDWFARLAKPDLTPPGWVFGVVWPVLYLMLGLAIAMILNARRAAGRGLAIALFVAHMLLNFAWSPIFFRLHQVWPAFFVIVAMLASAIVITALFARIRKAAAWLLVPYMVWLG
ncbi:MAG: tryptophan-rich sensory protein, partial [Sphingomonadales bacterium]|nr:tryptophan-rich sensory protein [Sphingomonadales bacterium]